MKNGESTAPTQRELAERMRAGDESAFDMFLQTHWDPLVRYIASFLGGADDAKDVAQEAFLRVWERRDGLRASGSVRAYLYQVARNLAINETKSRELHRTLNARYGQESPVFVRSPGREFESMEVREVVGRAIAALPERRREAFVLAHLQDMPHREIAEVMGISPQTVANQISAALGELRETLRPYMSENLHSAALQ